MPGVSMKQHPPPAFRTQTNAHRVIPTANNHNIGILKQKMSPSGVQLIYMRPAYKYYSFLLINMKEML